MLEHGLEEGPTPNGSVSRCSHGTTSALLIMLLLLLLVLVLVSRSKMELRTAPLFVFAER